MATRIGAGHATRVGVGRVVYAEIVERANGDKIGCRPLASVIGTQLDGHVEYGRRGQQNEKRRYQGMVEAFVFAVCGIDTH